MATNSSNTFQFAAAFPVQEQLPERLSRLLDRLQRRELARALVDLQLDRMSDAEVRTTLDQCLELVSTKLPGWMARSLQWLQEPSRRLIRFGAGVGLIFGGLLAFLPVLGVWMLPLGLIVLAQDFVFLQRPMLRALSWSVKVWRRWKRDH